MFVPVQKPFQRIRWNSRKDSTGLLLAAIQPLVSARESIRHCEVCVHATYGPLLRPLVCTKVYNIPKYLTYSTIECTDIVKPASEPDRTNRVPEVKLQNEPDEGSCFH